MALAYKGLASSELLSTYQTERIPVVTHMLAATSNLYTHLVPKESDTNDTDTNKTGFLQWRDQSLRMYDINYRWSPIVYDVRGTLGLDEDELKARAYVGYPDGDVHAGDRAPDASALVGSGRELQEGLCGV